MAQLESIKSSQTEAEQRSVRNKVTDRISNKQLTAVTRCWLNCAFDFVSHPLYTQRSTVMDHNAYSVLDSHSPSAFFNIIKRR